MASNQEEKKAEPSAQELAKETFLKIYATAPPEIDENEQSLILDTKRTIKDRIDTKVLCRFFVPVGRGRRQVGQCKAPLSSEKFFFRPRKVKGEIGEYHIRTELCDTTPKILPRQWTKLEAHFWLNNPNQIDYSNKGRDIVADARELANSHHRFVQKNLLEQDMQIYLVLALVGMILAVVGLGYGMTKVAEKTEIITLQDGTQFVYQNGQLVARGVGISPLPSAVQQQLNTANTED